MRIVSPSQSILYMKGSMVIREMANKMRVLGEHGRLIQGLALNFMLRKEL